MDISTLLNALSTLALVGALIFAGLQVRTGNRVREEQGAVTLIETALNVALVRPITLLADIKPDATVDQVEHYSPEMMAGIQEIGLRMETVGYMVYRRVVSLDAVDDLIGGTVTFWWDRMKPVALKDRGVTGNQRMYEWAQWLAERIAERRSAEPVVPAFLAHANWRP